MEETWRRITRGIERMIRMWKMNKGRVNEEEERTLFFAPVIYQASPNTTLTQIFWEALVCIFS